MTGFAAATVVWVVAAGIGYPLVRKLHLSKAAAVVFGAILGYAIVGGVVAQVAVAGGVSPRNVLIALAVLGLVAARPLVSLIRENSGVVAHIVSAHAGLTALAKVAIYISGFAVATAAVAAALPAVWWDPIAYHLPIASHALASGRFAFDVGMVQSAFPALGEAAALPAYALAGSAGAAMATLFAGVALAFLCALLSERLAPGTATLAFALVTCSALWLWLAPSFYVDIPFALFTVAAIALPLLPDRDDATNARWTYGALCGLLAGAAASVKYSGIGTGIVAIGILLFAGSRGGWKSAIGFVLGASVVAAGWYVRNFIATGDPVYPFLAGALHLPPSTVEFSQRYVEMTIHWCGGGATAQDLVSLPWRLLTEPRSFCGDPGYALRLGVIFVVVCVVTIRRSWPLALACAALTLLWFESSQQWRFLVPALALFAVLAAAGSAQLTPRLRSLAGVTLLVLCALGVLVDWLPSTLSEASNSIAPAYAYIAGRQDGWTYLDDRLETSTAAAWLRSHQVERSSVISLDDVRTYYFWGGIAWANPYYQERWVIDWTVAPGVRYGSLYAGGFRYLVANATRSYLARTPTGVNWTVLSEDVNAGRLRTLFTDGDVTIYEIVRPR